MTMHQIVISEFMDETAVARLADEYDVVYDPTLGLDVERLHDAVKNADALIVRNRTIVDAELLDAGKHVRVVGRLGVGLDNIDLDACADRDVAVKPATGANVDAVAEYVIAAVLMLTRGVFDRTTHLIRGQWPRSTSTGREVRGRTLGLVGYGAIAQRIAEIATVLHMHVIAHDPYLDPDDPAWKDAIPVGLRELLDRSDAVSVHVPLTPDTVGLIGPEAIASLRDGAILINTARGGVVDEEAVVEALMAGRMGGAALDVFRTEPIDEEAQELFADVPGLILTPHIAGVTQESNFRVSDMVANHVRAVLAEAPR